MTALNGLAGLALGWGGARLPVVLQSAAAECGLASLAMIAGYHRRNSDMGDLRRRISVSLKGVNLETLVDMADRIGFASRAVRLDLHELSNLKLPCILHWDLNHFVVLKSVSGSGIVIHDPAAGPRRLPNAEVSRHFSGIALELTPVHGFEADQPPQRVKWRSLLGNLVGLPGSLAQLFALAVAIEVFAVASPFFMQWVVDHALVTADRQLLVVLALGFGLLLLLRNTVAALRGWMLIVLGATLKVQSRTNLFTHLVRLPTAFFEARHLGDVVSRFGSQETILQAITTDLVETVLDGVLAIVTVVIMFLFAPMLAAMVLAGALLYGLLRWASYTPLQNASAEAIVWGARRDTHLLETLRGIGAIKLFNGQEGRRAHWLNLLIETVNRQLGAQKLRLLFKISNSLLVGMLAIGVVLVGAQQVLDNLMSVGMLLAFIAYKDQFMTRISNLIDKTVDLGMLRMHAERLADIALTQPEPRERSVDPGLDPHRPVSIEVRDLRFRYSDNDPWVLDGVSFKIEAGETVAIVGTSGGGKTTLLKILASLLQPSSGEILIDGEPLKNIGMSRWRSMIGVVMQDDHLFAGSLADNICFFAAEPDMLRIVQCAKQAALHDELVAMPMGYSTLIGDMGTVLSGGQKQRLLLARALYRRPGVLLLDEATSHLDVGNERNVNASIKATQVTRIIVAHRPETIRSADRVIVLDMLGERARSSRAARAQRLTLEQPAERAA
jgi:ATP-binding cassette, subfamily B, bacterial CvaB/MchF/RaxB